MEGDDGGRAERERAGSEAGALAYAVLGPLEVRTPDGPIDLPGRRQRAVLALLALNANRTVSAESLIDALWGEAPPATASAALQNAISQLRKAFERHGCRVSDVVLTRTGGYLLRAEPHQVDALRFEALIASAREALARGRPRRAAEQLREALDLWRGRPLDDLNEEASARSEIARLEELRLSAREDWVEAELALGHHVEVLGELRAMTAAHPYRERVWGQLMLALYRSGRQADALDAYQRARKVLAEELGIEPGPELQSLEWAILNQEPGLLRTEPSAEVRVSLPAPPTPFVGRESELHQVARMLRDPRTRLLTLTGPPGTGKTRLALAAASAVASDFGHVCFVELAAVADAEFILPATMVALGLRNPESPAEAIARHARDVDVLLVFDNFEHLVAGAAALSRILALAPRLRVLVTSRVPLRVSGEREYPVPPMALPDLERVADPSELKEYDAIAFFVDRAQAVRPDFELTTANGPALAELCVRLDGLPLAIALAASRLRMLSPHDVLARLRQRLDLLTGGPRDAPTRQQTLRAAIDWSYGLLGASERALFARLSVFRGSWTLEAAERVCDPDGTIGDVFELVGSLLEQSLVRREGSADPPRYGLLESIREYAAERLEERGESEMLRRSHATFYTALAEEIYTRRFEEARRASAILGREQDNLRAALEWLSRADTGTYLQLAGALGWYWAKHWIARSQFDEGLGYLDRALREPGGDPAHVARAVTARGKVTMFTGDVPAGISSLKEGVARWEELGDGLELAAALDALAWGYVLAGDTDAASETARRSVQLCTELGRRERATESLVTLCQLLVGQGQFEEAEPMAKETLAAARSANDAFMERGSWHLLGDCALMRGDPTGAEGWYREALRLGYELRHRLVASIDLQGIAMALAGQGRSRLALRLNAVAAREYESFRYDVEGMFPFWKQLLERYLGPARAAMGPDAQAAISEGRELSFESALALALDPSSSDEAAPPSPAGRPPVPPEPAGRGAPTG